MNRSLQSKLMLGGVGLMVAALLIFGIFSVMMISSAMKDEAKEHKALASMVDAVLREELKVAAELSAKESLTQAAAKVR